MRGNHVLGVVVACALSTVALADIIAEYDFTYVQSQSGLTAAVTSGLSAVGTLIGNYDEVNNPTGTRTKPGLFGPFGATENVAVNVNNLGAGLNGNLNTDTSGSFKLAIDTGAGTVVMSDWATNFLGNGPASLPVTVSLSTETFRTRNPTFLYPGIPISIPIGQAQITTMSLVQAGPSLGTMTQTGANTYDFSVAALVNLSLSASVLGQTFDLPSGTALPFGFAGSMTLNGNQAQVTALTPILFDQTFNPDQVLPQFALDLPTLDPDAPAQVLLDLTLGEIGAQIDGSITTLANGVLIPSPASAAVVACAFLTLPRRRRPSGSTGFQLVTRSGVAF